MSEMGQTRSSEKIMVRSGLPPRPDVRANLLDGPLSAPIAGSCTAANLEQTLGLFQITLSNPSVNQW